MDSEEKLRNVTRRRVRKKGYSKLGEIVSEYLGQRVSPQQARFAALTRAWCQLLPSELGRHCALADFSNGRLKVVVDSPAHLYELQLCRDELLEQLQRRCWRTPIKTVAGEKRLSRSIHQIKFVIGSPSEVLNQPATEDKR